MTKTPKVPSGVQELVSRLRDEGVKAGQQEAERLLQEAQNQADQIVAQAKAEAEAIRNQARKEIEAERAASREAIQMAFRDTQLKLRSNIKAAFAARVRRLVSMELQDRDFLRQTILHFFGRATSNLTADQPVELRLSDELFVTDETGTRLTEKGRGALHHLVLGISGEMMRQGVELKPAGNNDGGMRIQLVGEDLEIDLSDKAISDLLIGYLIPRFRAIAEGVE